TPLMGSAWKFHKRGQSGLDVSELFQNVAECADDLAMISSCYTESFVHAQAMYQMVSGRTVTGHPSVGSWVTYGLGSVSENLPAYCVLPQPQGLPEGGAPCWSNAFLPAIYQGTLLRRGPSPILNLKPPADVSPEQNRRSFELAKKLNELSAAPGDQELEARIASYELAFRMQQHAPEAVDLSKETAATKTAYGLDDS